MKLHQTILLLSILTILSCKKDDPIAITQPQLILKFKFDDTQQRLDNLGQPAVIPNGHAAQTPVFHLMGAHYVELSKANDIPAYNGTQLFKSPTTTAGGSEAIDFDEALYAKDNEAFFRMNIADINPGTFKYLRMSLSYQNFDINFRVQGQNLTGRLASFVGANSYIRDFQINNETIAVNDNKLQGYWAFETDFPGVDVLEGQAPEGATTVPNPLAATSAIPPGSCLVTGVFETPFELTGTETEDVIITISISTNNSFEWMDTNGNGIYEPADGEVVVDMGVRGLIPMVE